MKSIILKKKNDLFNYSFFSFVFKNKTFLFVLRTLLLGIFMYAIYYGFVYPNKAENIFTTSIFWGLFWPFFIVISLASFGRIFCGICPHGFLGKYISKISLKKELPKFFKKPIYGLVLLIVFYWFMIFLFPGIFRSSYNSAVFFALLTAFSFVVFFVYKDMSYCKYFCPIGTVTKVFSKISFTKLETYKIGCSTCKTFDCAKACEYKLKPFTFSKKNSMEDCTLCMDCAVSCENVAFSLVKPSSSLLNKFKTNKYEVWAIILLTSILSFAMTFSHALGRTAIADNFIWIKSANYVKSFWKEAFINLESSFALFYAIISVVLICIIGMFIASKILKVEYEKIFYFLGYSFIPLFIIGSLSHILEFFFLHYASNIINGFIQAFNLNFSYLEPLSKRGDTWLHIFKIFTHFAYIWAFILLYQRFKLIQASKIRKIFAFPFAGALIIFYMGLTFYTRYVFKEYGVKKNHFHKTIDK